MAEQLFGYRRENGRVGIRNHVVIISVDDISNAAVEAVEKIVPGTLAVPHAYGRLQYGPDLELFFRTIIGNGSNPNVAAVIVIGIEPKWTERIVEGIKKTGKPVAGFSIERHGDLATIEKAARVAQRFVQNASEFRREPVQLSEIRVSIKCGESDTTTGLASCPTVGRVVDRLVDENGTVIFGETSELTGGEHLIADRAISAEVREKFYNVYHNYVDEIASKGVDLLGSQPTEGNVRGGLTTIEEKAMGNIQKTGSKPIVDILGPAVEPIKKGLNFMDSSSAAAEFITLAAASGAVVHFFPTGQGNIVGNPIVPVVKISANPLTIKTMSEHIDVDVSGILKRELSLKGAGDLLFETLLRTINGRFTAAESLGHREFVLTKLYRSA
ncbi:MAG: UxaA family hydrolase [Sporolactobacillus sp.]|nr:UxaA family hydrolase [Sporolactobacillus sp.]